MLFVCRPVSAAGRPIFNEERNMAREMNAVVAYGPKDYKVTKVPVPEIGPGEALMKVAACGICGSDVHAYHGASSYWGDEKTAAWMKAPVIPGHEFSGVIDEIDAVASQKWGVKKGDRVVVEQIIPCGECLYCREGDYNLCAVHNIFGFQKDVAEGAWAEYCRLGAKSLVHKIPDSLSMNDAATVEPLSCALHAFERGQVRLSDTVVVAGMGTIGGFIVQLARLANPKCLVVVDVMDNRLELAKQYGADVVINAKTENAVKKVMDLTDGYGCNVYYEVTGNPIGAIQGLDMIRKKGRFVEYSVFSGPTTVDWSVIGEKKAIDIRGAHLGPYCYPAAINLLASGKVTTKGLITGTFPLTDFENALKVTEDASRSIKNLLIP
jgi:Threonine dehydrogenase and related Zn-dependent dehydrogenases